MSKRSSSPKPKKKARGPAAAPDVYVSLLFVSVASLITGLSFLAYELSRYNWTMAAG
jgi:hypothetical protein